jgi:nucleoside-diphosphate-sugar epimerase
MSRVLLTGATGFIGRHAIAPLVAAGHEVHAVSRAPAHDDRVTWHRADLLDARTDVVTEVGPDAMLHFAWYAEHGLFWAAPENVRWVEASLRMLRQFAEAGGARAVLAGTCAEYDWRVDVPAYEERRSPLRPATLYGSAKHALHTVASAYAEQAGFELAWGRIFFLYGPGEAPGRLVPAVARALLAGEPAEATSGTQIRDFLHVRDVAAAFAALLDSDVVGPVNVGSGEARPLRDVIATLAEAVGRPELVRLGALPARAGEPERIVADASRLHEEVGFAPRFGLREGLEDTVAELRRATGVD